MNVEIIGFQGLCREKIQEGPTLNWVLGTYLVKV